MVAIIKNAADRTGDFRIKFLKKYVNFYGTSITEGQAFHYYGTLPDNQVLVNKLINNLGRNLLALEKEALEIQANPTISDSLKAKTLFYSEIERESNALNIQVFDRLSSLEQNRKPTLEQRELLKKEINTLYEDRIKKYDAMIARKDLSTIQRDEIQRYKTQIEQSRQALLGTLTDPNQNTRRIYRQVMENFADEQRIISVFQHNSARPLVYANRSLTEAYQNASYAMEKHVFSIEPPTDNQLWKELSVAEDIEINTAMYPSMRKKDALFSACFIKDSQSAFVESEKAIKEIQDISRNNRNPVQKKEAGLSPKDGFSTYTTYLKTEQERQAITRSEAPSRQLAPEEEVHLYHYSTLFSSIGMACSDVGKYLESEMGAKKPVLTMATFIAMSASFGAAGLAAAGSTSAHAALGAYSKLVTAGGYTGITPDQCQSIIQNISNTWGNLTYSSGSTLHTLIMNMALGKLGFVGFDKMFHGAEHRDLLSQMAERLKKQDLTGKTSTEEQIIIAKNILIVSTLVVAAVGLGLGAEHLASLSGIAHTMGTGMTSFVDTPLEVFTALKATSVPAEMVAMCSLALTVKSSAMFLGKVALVLEHMNIKDEKKNAACLFMAGLKEAVDNNANLSVLESFSQEKLKEHYDNFQNAIKEHPELARNFGTEFLNKVGIEVPKPSLISRVGSAGAALGNALNNYLIKGTLLPLGHILIAPVSLPLYRYAGVDVGTVKALLSIGDAVSRIGVGVAAAGKLIATSTWGTIQRIGMAAVDTGFGVALGVNSIVRGGGKGIGWGIRGLLEKPLVNVGSILSDVARFSVGILKYAVGLPVGIVTGGASGIVGLVKGKQGEILKNGLEGFKKGFMAPLHVADNLRKGCETLKSLCANEVDRINTNLLQAPGSSRIQNLRNGAVSAVGDFFNKIKVAAGFVVYRARSAFIRPQENLMQAHLKKQEEDNRIKQAAVKVADTALAEQAVIAKKVVDTALAEQDVIAKKVADTALAEQAVIAKKVADTALAEQAVIAKKVVDTRLPKQADPLEDFLQRAKIRSINEQARRDNYAKELIEWFPKQIQLADSSVLRKLHNMDLKELTSALIELGVIGTEKNATKEAFFGAFMKSQDHGGKVFEQLQQIIKNEILANPSRITDQNTRSGDGQEQEAQNDLPSTLLPKS